MALWLDPQPLVLGSRSSARRDMLTAAGIPVELRPADIDERAVEARAGQLEPAQAALLLARKKPWRQARSSPGVLSSARIRRWRLVRSGFPSRRIAPAAREQLQCARRRRPMSCTRRRGGARRPVVFSHVDTARLTMRALSDDFHRHLSRCRRRRRICKRRRLSARKARHSSVRAHRGRSLHHSRHAAAAAARVSCARRACWRNNHIGRYIETVQPSSTGMVTPVTSDAASEHSQITDVGDFLRRAGAARRMDLPGAGIDIADRDLRHAAYR